MAASPFLVLICRFSGKSVAALRLGCVYVAPLRRSPSPCRINRQRGALKKPPGVRFGGHGPSGGRFAPSWAWPAFFPWATLWPTRSVGSGTAVVNAGRALPCGIDRKGATRSLRSRSSRVGMAGGVPANPPFNRSHITAVEVLSRFRLAHLAQKEVVISLPMGNLVA